MKAWVFLCNDSPLEHWMEGYMERFDAWEEGGVTGLVVGRMQFCQTDGTPCHLGWDRTKSVREQAHEGG